MDWIGFDYVTYFYPALQALLAGGSPYINPEVGNPPWIFWLLSPLGLLPISWSLVAINLISVAGLVTLFFVNQKKWMALALAISYPFLVLLCHGNLEGLTLWGLAVGGPIGLILLTAKPQAAILVAAVWAVKAWKRGGWREIAILFGPLAALTLVGVLLYPAWIDNLIWFANRGDGGLINGFPWLVPIGIGLFILAIRQERQDLAAVATILIAPYARIQSWTVPLCLLALSYPIEGSIMALSTWLLFFHQLRA